MCIRDRLDLCVDRVTARELLETLLVPNTTLSRLRRHDKSHVLQVNDVEITTIFRAPTIRNETERCDITVVSEHRMQCCEERTLAIPSLPVAAEPAVLS